MNPERRALLALTLAGSAALAATPLRAQGSAEPIRLALIEGLSGPFGNAGDAVFRNLLWAVERINQRGGVRLPSGARPLELQRFDSKGQTEEALAMLRGALDQKFAFVFQGNSSATALALVDALEKHNQREPARRALFLNYSAVDPSLTNERCSFWHFRFDAHADMRLAALTEVLQADRAVKKVYLIGQDYSFGQHVGRKAREMIAARRPDIQIVGDELHPLGRVKDFIPYAAKIQASGAQAVLTGNWCARCARWALKRGSTPFMATRSACRRPSARPAWAGCWRWPNGTRTWAAKPPTTFMLPSASVSRSRKTTTFTPACR